MILGNRLECILKMADNSETLLDVGCDHAYLAIEAIKRNTAKKVIASDVNEGPLKKAKENIIRAVLSDNIQLRLGSGIEVIEKNEVDTVVMAGMGGILISEILEKNPSLSKTVKRYILQPMNSKEDLRKYLISHGYTIEYEALSEDNGKIYSILCVSCNKQTAYEKEIFYHTGNLLNLKYTEKNLIEKYIIKTESKLRKINENLRLARNFNKEQADYTNKLLEELLWLKSEISKS